MLKLQTVICAVDFSELSKRELQLAVEVCQAFGARLLVHHNMAGTAPGFAREWEWKEVHRGDEMSMSKVEERMQAVLADVSKQIRAEATVTAGPVVPVMLQLVEQARADLVIVGSHGWSTEDHASVAERLIERCPCPVLTLQDTKEAPPPFQLHAQEGLPPAKVVVPTDFSTSADRAVAYAFDLARTVPVTLQLVHVLTGKESDAEVTAATRKLQEMVPAELANKVDCHMPVGNPVEQITRFIATSGAGLVIMGEHARSFFRRLFTKDTAREVLHRSAAPVWFVPEAKSA
jgi:nucleotide-binding universal stress UspA family protein